MECSSFGPRSATGPARKGAGSDVGSQVPDLSGACGHRSGSDGQTGVSHMFCFAGSFITTSLCFGAPSVGCITCN